MPRTHVKESTSETTTDHETIRQWAEARNGRPARARETAGKSSKGKTGGVLRIDFGRPEAALEPISWDEFFEIFEENQLAFLYQEHAKDGETSRFFKFVARDDRGDRAQ